MNQPSTFSNLLGAAPPLSLDTLRAAYQRLMICGLCGRRIDLSERARVVGAWWTVHVRCAPADVVGPA